MTESEFRCRKCGGDGPRMVATYLLKYQDAERRAREAQQKADDLRDLLERVEVERDAAIAEVLARERECSLVQLRRERELALHQEETERTKRLTAADQEDAGKWRETQRVAAKERRAA